MGFDPTFRIVSLQKYDYWYLISRNVSTDLIPLHMCDFFDVLIFVDVFSRGLNRQRFLILTKVICAT